MKITEITAHLVKTDKEDVRYNIYGPYWRIQTNSEYIAWCMAPHNGDEITYIPNSKLRDALEQEFKETHGVMHEQLELFNV
jgi:hypothetical protein